MPITWTQEADIQLLLGLLDQFKESNFKIDYKKLAEFMGRDVTACAVLNHIIKLRKKIEGDAASAASPVASKRKSVAEAKTRKKGKGKIFESGMEDGEEVSLKKRKIDSDEDVLVKQEYVKEEVVGEQGWIKIEEED
ncbi:hypothetical protein BDV28DRAFT_147191 [Aspergillus coremiiformis]|uniref:Uncharacterized protein n=1 Tax=Aspergillus coremiiformis TaxID=138285 RepID=A0A5N6ZC79_9EURO|nr:hypothetical protein BDV28DRAFT_147191 [Aspergillus coremiiformis]